ncbi:MFS transporter [Labrys sp. LIt4]|uniref:MFS transporter n=1 Tax=Labrys sp. LIt4 TaxID=2821355 RepID=UPI0032B011B9
MSRLEPGTPTRRALSSPLAIVLGVGGLYVGQSIIGGLTFIALPSVLRERNLPLDQIGLLYLAVLPWAFKFLWAPAVERYRLPATGHSRSRSIVLLGGLISAAGLMSAGLIGPSAFMPLLIVLLLIAFATSTSDIACDGHAVETLSERYHGWGNAAQVGGAYLGSAIGSGLFLVLVAQYGWGVACFAMAALLIGLGLLFVVSPAPPSPGRDHRPSLRQALQRRDMHLGLALAAVNVIAQKWGVSMLGPFLIDSGLDLTSLGIVNGVGGMAVGFVCALIGGALVRLCGARTVLALALMLQAVALSGLAYAAWKGGVGQPLLLILALASSSGIMALGFVALYAQFMAVSDPRQAGIDFTLLQCMDALVSMAGGMGAGWIAQHWGYGLYFGLAALLALAAAPIAAILSHRVAVRSDARKVQREALAGVPSGR